MLVDLECDGPARLEAQANIAASVDSLDRPKLAIRHTLLPIRRCELNSIARKKGAVGLTIDRDAAEPARIVGEALRQRRNDKGA